MNTTLKDRLSECLNCAHPFKHEVLMQLISDCLKHIEELEKEVKRNDPELDATYYAHPAWWRGNDHGSLMTAQRMEESVDGKDNGHGIIGNEHLERVRRKGYPA